MKAGGYRAGRIFFFLAILPVCFIFDSCAPKDPSLKFSADLQAIDKNIAGGNADKAEKSLARLRKSASSTSQWLSIAKRERSLGKADHAVTTLKAALKKLPASTVLTGVLVDTLTAADRLDEACAYSSALIDTPYAYLAAYPEIKLALKKDQLQVDPLQVDARQIDGLLIDPRFYIASFSMTDNPLFLRDAAVVYAAKGLMAAACDLTEKKAPSIGDHTVGDTADERLFRATLCYDTGMFDRVFRYLPGSHPSESFSETGRYRKRDRTFRYLPVSDQAFPIRRLGNGKIPECSIAFSGIFPFPKKIPTDGKRLV